MNFETHTQEHFLCLVGSSTNLWPPTVVTARDKNISTVTLFIQTLAYLTCLVSICKYLNMQYHVVDTDIFLSLIYATV